LKPFRRQQSNKTTRIFQLVQHNKNNFLKQYGENVKVTTGEFKGLIVALTHVGF